MAVDGFSGPLVSFGFAAAGGGLGYAQDSNPDAGPSMFYSGFAILDPRTPFTYSPGQKSTKPFYGFLGSSPAVVDAAPSALSTTAIAAAQVPTAGTALTLVSASGAGITVGASVVNALTGRSVGSLLAIDGAMGSVGFGSAGSVSIWDPTKAIARNVQIASTGNDSTATFTVRGYDVYGYPLTEVITGANVGTAAGHKAFKYVASITPAGTLSGSNVSAGQGDTYGFGLRVDQWAYADIYWAGALVTSNTGFTAADTTSPATGTTGDVRGTYHVQSASNGTNKLQVFITPQVANIGSVTGLFGVTNYSG